MPRFTELRFRCSECKKVFYSKKALATHMRASHSTLGDFACNTCQHHFMTVAAYRRHVFFSHPGAQPENLCTTCDRRFFTTKELENHVNVVHTNNQVDYQCEICFYTYQNRDALEGHKRSKHVVQSNDIDAGNQDEPTPEDENIDDDSASIPPTKLKLQCPSAHACEQCGRFYATRKSLKTHQSLKHRKRNEGILSRLRELPQTDMDQEVVEDEETPEEDGAGSVTTIATNIAREAARLIKENSINFTSRLFKNFFLILSNTTAGSPDGAQETQGACSSLHRREPISNSIIESSQEPPLALASPAWNTAANWPPTIEFENKFKTIFELNQDALGDKNFCNMSFEQINELLSSFH